jgi:hypothetical protein
LSKKRRVSCTAKGADVSQIEPTRGVFNDAAQACEEILVHLETLRMSPAVFGLDNVGRVSSAESAVLALQSSLTLNRNAIHGRMDDGNDD